MSAHGDETATYTRLYTFPGGVFEIEESLGDELGVGVYLEHRPRQSRNDTPASSPGVSGDDPEVA